MHKQLSNVAILWYSTVVRYALTCTLNVLCNTSILYQNHYGKMLTIFGGTYFQPESNMFCEELRINRHVEYTKRM